MGLTRDEVKHIAVLARLGLSEEEVARFQEQLSNILDNFRILKEVDTTDVPPTAHTLALENVWREDEPQPSFPKEDILRNAPRREEDSFRVKAILEG